MGKPEVDRLQSAKLQVTNSRYGPYMNQDVQQPENHKSLNVEMITDGPSPKFEILDTQVAGHINDEKSFGMLKFNDTVLKPITDIANGKREIEFYEELSKTTDKTLLELKQFVPEYFGLKTVSLKGREVECIVLEDLTRHFKEPCIMDIKIGKRTWDPTASQEKITNEEKKYQETKRELGLCLPGFLIHNLSTGRCCRYGKDYGKKLNKDTFKDALRIFLNENGGFCRDLLLQLLANLWRILHWARKQTKVCLFSSSILFIYDARKLRQPSRSNHAIKPPTTSPQRSTNLYKPLSIMKLNDDHISTGFSGQFTEDGPILTPLPSSKIVNLSQANFSTKTHPPWEKQHCKLRRVHSFQNNFDEDLQHLKRDYVHILDDLVAEQKSEVWGIVKMIDFAHVFPSENNQVDKNYLEGIENLVKILESFLTES